MKIRIDTPQFKRDKDYLRTHRKFILRLISMWLRYKRPTAFILVPLKDKPILITTWSNFTFSHGEQVVTIRLHYNQEKGIITEQQFHILS